MKESFLGYCSLQDSVIILLNSSKETDWILIRRNQQDGGQTRIHGGTHHKKSPRSRSRIIFLLGTIQEGHSKLLNPPDFAGTQYNMALHNILRDKR